MAPSCRSSRASSRVLLGVVALAVGAALAQTPRPASSQLPPLIGRSDLPVELTAKSSEVDYTNNTLVFTDVVISQGGTRVSADHAHATGLDFVKSTWTFDGRVRIDAPPRGSLRADSAVVEFRNNRIERATAKGLPADFEQTREGSDQIARGHANQIVYDVNQGTVLLTNDAWISDGRNEMSAPSISYSIREQKVLATSSGAHQGVHITITPQASPKPAPPREHKGTTAPPPASGASGPPPASSTPAPVRA